MKSAVLLILIIPLFCYTQDHEPDYVPIPADTTAHWRIIGYNMVGGDCITRYDYWYYIGEKKIINNKAYRALYSRGPYYYETIWPESPCDGEGYNYGTYEGALRTENNIVYFYYGGRNNILFDYHFEVGDTLPNTLYFLEQCWLSAIVESIDSVETKDGTYLKRWNIHFEESLFEPISFIEGIGTTLGIFHWACPGEWGSNFFCYAENNQPVYPAGSNCNPTVNIPEIQVYEISLTTSPNPFSSFTTLSYELKQPSSVQFSIYNPFGQLVYQRKEEQQQGTQQLEWDAQGLSEGLYFYKLNAGNQTTTGKLVKASH